MPDSITIKTLPFDRPAFMLKQTVTGYESFNLWTFEHLKNQNIVSGLLSAAAQQKIPDPAFETSVIIAVICF